MPMSDAALISRAVPFQCQLSLPMRRIYDALEILSECDRDWIADQVVRFSASIPRPIDLQESDALAVRLVYRPGDATNAASGRDQPIGPGHRTTTRPGRRSPSQS